MDAAKFGAFIAETRRQRGMTQAALAARLHVTDKAVSRWERGLGFPDISTIEPLAAALGVSVLELMRSERLPEGAVSSEEASEVIADTLTLAQQQRNNTFFDVTTALACLLCAGVTLYLTSFEMVGETLVFFAAIGGMAIGAQRFAKEVSFQKRRKAAIAVAVSFLFVFLAGSYLMDASAVTSRYTFVFLVYFYPVMLAISIVLLVRRILMLRGRPDHIEWGDPYATGGFLAESSDPPHTRAIVAMGYTIWLVAGCLVGGVRTLSETADILRNTPEQAVTLQYAQLCLERDCGVAPEQIETTAFTLTPEEEWSNSWEDLYSYTFTWEGETSAESRCYSLVFFDDFTCELIGQGPDYAASLANAQAELEWRQSGHTTPRR